MLKIGDIDIHIINDARILADTGGMFGLVPRALWSRYYEPDDMSRIPIHHNCLLVKANGLNIVVDTGIGTKVPDKMAEIMSLERPGGGLVGGLARHDVAPEDVNIVINTHLHSDHCGGNTYFDEDGQLRPTFPNAEYRVQRLEYADAAYPNERTRGTYFPQNFSSLLASGQMVLIDGDEEIVPGMRCVVTPGHTRGHMSVTFEQNGEAAFYVGDMASLSVHFARLAWLTAYDVEPLVNLETKRRWQQWVQERNALILFEHDPYASVGRPGCNEDGKYYIKPVE